MEDLCLFWGLFGPVLFWKAGKKEVALIWSGLIPLSSALGSRLNLESEWRVSLEHSARPVRSSWVMFSGWNKCVCSFPRKDGCFSLPCPRLFIINTREGNHWSDPLFNGADCGQFGDWKLSSFTLLAWFFFSPVFGPLFFYYYYSRRTIDFGGNRHVIIS